MLETTGDLDAERQELRRMWELATAFNFLHVFRPVLRLGLEFSAEDLETGLLRPNAVLQDVHIGLLKGIPPLSRNLDRTTWASHLFAKIKDRWKQVAEGDLPWKPAKGEEVDTYKSLPWHVRVHILKALCELRLDCDDMKEYIETSLKTGALDVSQLRLECLGVDSSARKYWYDTGHYLGCRLYREEPASLPAVKGNRGVRTKAPLGPPPGAGQWEVAAITLPQFQALQELLASTRARMDVKIAKKLRENIIPEVDAGEQKRARQIKRQQKQALLLMEHLQGSGLAAGRAKRERKPVNYTFEDYDKIMSEATGDRRRRRGSPSPEPEHAHSHALSREERLRLRRGEALAELQGEDGRGTDGGFGVDGSREDNRGMAELAEEPMVKKLPQSTGSGRTTQKPARHVEHEDDSESPQNSDSENGDEDQAVPSKRADDDDDYMEEDESSQDDVEEDDISEYEEDDEAAVWSGRPKSRRTEKEPAVGVRKSARPRKKNNYAAMVKDEESGDEGEEEDPPRSSVLERAQDRSKRETKQRSATKFRNEDDDDWRSASDVEESDEEEEGGGEYDDDDDDNYYLDGKTTSGRHRENKDDGLQPQLKKLSCGRLSSASDLNARVSEDDSEDCGMGSDRGNHETGNGAFQKTGGEEYGNKKVKGRRLK